MVVRRLVAALVLMPVLGACSDKGGESGADPSEPASSATVEPTPTESPGPPELPAAAQAEGQQAARSFVSFYFDLLTYAMKTGDTSVVPEYSRPDCQSCASIPRRIRNVYDKGFTLRTRGWAVEAIAPSSESGPNELTFFVRVRQSPNKVFDESGKLVDTSKRALVGMRIVVQRGDHWIVRRLDVIR